MASVAAVKMMAVAVIRVAEPPSSGERSSTGWLETMKTAINATARRIQMTPTASPPRAPIPTVSAHPTLARRSDPSRRAVSASPRKARASSTVTAG